MEPGRTFSDNWHIGVIAEHLEACSRGEIRKLLINMPPRHMKSLMVSVFWFAWTWTFQPSSRWLYASYAQTLATRDSRKCRRLIQSPWYRERFGNVTLVGDQNQKMRFENDQTGYRIATAVDALGTGEGGEYIICDDAHNVKDGESTAKRTAAVDWWFATMATRANDPATVRRVIVGQRVHDSDISGEVLKRELGYEHLCIPARFEAGTTVAMTSLQRARPELQDPRTTEGELLHGERINEAELSDLERELGTYNAAGQLQQRPVPRTGGVFSAAGLPTRDANGRAHVEPMGDDVARVRYYDIGGTDSKRGDWTCGVLLAKRDGKYCVVDVVRGQWAPNERNARILATAQADAAKYGSVRTVVERGIGLANEVTDNIVRHLAGYRIEVKSTKGDKESRADPLSDQCAGGNVYLCEAAWNADFIDECLRFPRVDHDDQVDAFSGAFAELSQSRRVRIDL